MHHSYRLQPIQIGIWPAFALLHQVYSKLNVYSFMIITPRLNGEGREVDRIHYSLMLYSTFFNLWVFTRELFFNKCISFFDYEK